MQRIRKKVYSFWSVNELIIKDFIIINIRKEIDFLNSYQTVKEVQAILRHGGRTFIPYNYNIIVINCQKGIYKSMNNRIAFGRKKRKLRIQVGRKTNNIVKRDEKETNSSVITKIRKLTFTVLQLFT